ncbi:hypothetical protein Z949_2528 [Sulfitobacter guttiformis KCTC 32187]|nr:hypothetical protein Z949_2528 [Sulfitobacter guttiformis KCTC 32187]
MALSKRAKTITIFRISRNIVQSAIYLIIFINGLYFLDV